MLLFFLTIEFENFDFDILIGEKSKENILIYDISYNLIELNIL